MIIKFLKKLIGLNLENVSGVNVTPSTPDFLLKDLFSADCFADVDYQEECRKYEEWKRAYHE